jgi:hypothetical protein
VYGKDGRNQVTTTLLAIDPGQDGLSASLFINGRLSDGVVVHLPAQTRKPDSLDNQARAALQAICARSWPMPQAIAVERMRYLGAGQHQSAQLVKKTIAILDLQAIGGLVAGAYPCPKFYYYPSEWMGGSLADHIVQHRVWAKLDSGEGQILERILMATPKALQHNAFDSAAIGLSHLGRWL